MRYCVRTPNPEVSILVQKILFKNEMGWPDKKVQQTDRVSLCFNLGDSIGWLDDNNSVGTVEEFVKSYKYTFLTLSEFLRKFSSKEDKMREALLLVPELVLTEKELCN